MAQNNNNNLKDINAKIAELDSAILDAKDGISASAELPQFSVRLTSKNIYIKLNASAYNIMHGMGVKSLERYPNNTAKLSYKGAQARAYIEMAKALKFAQVEEQRQDIALQDDIAKMQAQAWQARLTA